MNIVFVHESEKNTFDQLFPWRGKLFFNSLQKSGVHSVELIEASTLTSTNWSKQKAISESNIILIDGSTSFDFLDFIITLIFLY